MPIANCGSTEPAEVRLPNERLLPFDRVSKVDAINDIAQDVAFACKNNKERRERAMLSSCGVVCFVEKTDERRDMSAKKSRQPSRNVARTRS